MDETFSQAFQKSTHEEIASSSLTSSENRTTTHVTTQEESSSNIYNFNLSNTEDEILSFPLEAYSRPMSQSQDTGQRRENFEDESETTSLYWIPPKVLERDCMRKMPRKIPGKYVMSTSIDIIARSKIDFVC